MDQDPPQASHRESNQEANQERHLEASQESHQDASQDRHLKMATWHHRNSLLLPGSASFKELNSKPSLPKDHALAREAA